MSDTVVERSTFRRAAFILVSQLLIACVLAPGDGGVWQARVSGAYLLFDAIVFALHLAGVFTRNTLFWIALVATAAIPLAVTGLTG